MARINDSCFLLSFTSVIKSNNNNYAFFSAHELELRFQRPYGESAILFIAVKSHKLSAFVSHEKR
jgi:hypothetical protein